MRVPSEPALAATNGIARMTARHAIDELVQEGLLVRHRGRGTFVAEPKLSYPPASLFSFTRTMAELGYAVSTRLLTLELVPAHGEIPRALRVAEGELVLLVRRLRFANREPVALHESYMDRGYLKGLIAADLLTRPIADAMEKVNGRRIVASRDFLEAAAATKEEAVLLTVGIGEPVQLVIGVAYGETGEPVLATRAVYRADRFRFAVAAQAGDLPFEIKKPTAVKANGEGKGLEQASLTVASAETRR